MRKSAPIDALFPRTRQGILAATLLQPERAWYLSGLARHLGVSPSSLQRELAALVSAGILCRHEDGNRVYFSPDRQCPFLADLTGMLIKTAGLVDVLTEALRPFRKELRVAFTYGSIARGDERSTSDIDLMLIGNIGLVQVAPALRKAEIRVGRPINATIFTEQELAAKLEKRHHFLVSVAAAEKLFIIGTPDDLEKASRVQSRQVAQDEPSRTKRPASRRRP